MLMGRTLPQEGRRLEPLSPRGVESSYNKNLAARAWLKGIDPSIGMGGMRIMSLDVPIALGLRPEGFS